MVVVEGSLSIFSFFFPSLSTHPLFSRCGGSAGLLLQPWRGPRNRGSLVVFKALLMLMVLAAPFRSCTRGVDTGTVTATATVTSGWRRLFQLVDDWVLLDWPSVAADCVAGPAQQVKTDVLGAAWASAAAVVCSGNGYQLPDGRCVWAGGRVG